LLGRRRKLGVGNVRTREGIIRVDKSRRGKFRISADCISAGVVRLLFFLRQNGFAVDFAHLII
jgi:hypothetical protein